MKRLMKMLAAVAVMVAAGLDVVADSSGKTIENDSSWQQGPSKEWFVNWDKALASARSTGKPLFVLNTGSDWCHWCRKLREEVLEKPDFLAFASNNLTLLYLDSPSRNPLGKEQKSHNRMIIKALPFGGGVPHALIVNAKGEKIGSISGGGLELDKYLEKLNGICADKGTPIDGHDARVLFTDGYAKLAAEIAARRALFPPVTTNDFKAVLTGVAVVDRERRYGNRDCIEFVSPKTPLVVPYGKTALFRVEYDFPEGYGARVWVRDGLCNDKKSHSGYFGSNPSGLFTGKGVAYGFLSLLDRGKECTLSDVKIRTNSEPELDEFPHGWTIQTSPVDVTFKAKEGADGMSAADGALNRLWPSENAKRTAEPQQDKSKSAIDMLRERRRKSKEAVKQAILEPFLPFADAVRKAKEGDGAGLYSVAIHYARGVEIAPDSALAMKYLEKAVVARHANAALVKALIMEYQFKDSPDTNSDGKKMFDADDLSIKDHVSRRMLYERMGSRYASFRLPHDADWYCATNESAVAEIRCAYLEAKELGSPYAAEELNRFKRRMERVRKEAEERRAAEKAWRKKVDANARLAQEMLGETPAAIPEYDPQRISLNLSDKNKLSSQKSGGDTRRRGADL